MSGESLRRRRLAFLALWVLGCESEVETYDGGHDAATDDAAPGEEGTTEVPGEDATGDAAPDEGPADDGGAVSETDCGAAEGVSVSGTIRFDGTFPETARLWAAWMDELGTPGMPHCMLELTPVAFPAAFRFTGVPRGETWALQALLDVSGGFPPVPTPDDFAGGYPSGSIDLSGDVEGLVITLTPYAP